MSNHGRFARLASTVIAGTALTGCALGGDEPLPAESSELGVALEITPRIPASKATPLTDIPPGFRRDVAILKFHEGSRVRWDGAKLVQDAAGLTRDDRARLKRDARLAPEDIPADLAKVSQVLASIPGLTLVPLIADAKAFEAERVELEADENEELADLALYYRIVTTDASALMLVKALNALNTVGVVETAYPQPEGGLASFTDERTPLRESLVSAQGYRGAAPAGVDADFAATMRGGRGAGTKIIDIEFGANFAHDDLKQPFYRSGFEVTNSHGTQVMGVLVGRDDSIGVTGIASDAEVGMNTPAARVAFGPIGVMLVPWDPSGAIVDAATHLNRGDVILIEQHYPIPFLDIKCKSCNCSQFGYAPVEYWQNEFDAIRYATARGVVVVEAAGNGQLDLDASRMDRRFERSRRDSRAIMVGSGSSKQRPLCHTNFGARVDVQSWGEKIATTMWNDLPNDRDENRLYTLQFGGTSGASAIVAGVTASLQGVRKAAGRAVLSPREMLSLLRSTGSPQAAADAGERLHQIGPNPNMRDAIERTLR